MKETLNKILVKISRDQEKGTSTPTFVFIVAVVGLAAYLIYTFYIR